MILISGVGISIWKIRKTRASMHRCGFPAGRRDFNVYALVGVHIDKWETTVTYDSTDDSETTSNGHLGLRAGVGLNAGPFFVEARYRITEGNLNLPGRGMGSWSAVEMGAGFRFGK